MMSEVYISDGHTVKYYHTIDSTLIIKSIMSRVVYAYARLESAVCIKSKWVVEMFQT